MKVRTLPRLSLQKFVATLLLLSSATMGGLWLLGMLRVGRSPVSEKAAPAAEIRAVQPTEETARLALSNYFAAADDSARIHCLHDRERVKELWLDYHRRRRHPLPLLDDIHSGTLVEDRGRIMAFFEVILIPGGRQPVALVWEGNSFNLDWESFVAYGTMDWAEWMESRPTVPQTLRVYLSRVPTGPLSESPSGYDTISIEHRDSLGPVLVRVDPGSGLSLDFSGRQRIPVTAEFAFRQDASGMQPYLVRLVHEGWTD